MNPQWLEEKAAQLATPNIPAQQIVDASLAIEKRMSWASMHWNQLHPDQIPHVAFAALQGAGEPIRIRPFEAKTEYDLESNTAQYTIDYTPTITDIVQQLASEAEEKFADHLTESLTPYLLERGWTPPIPDREDPSKEN